MEDLDANSLIVFHHIVKAGSLTRAADELDVTRSALSHRIKAIEARIGCPLLVRSTRDLSLTDAGYRLLGYAERLAGTLSEANLLANGLNQDTAGQIRIAAPPGLGQVWLRPLLLAYMQANPRVTVQLSLSERPVNLIKDRIDLAIRVTSRLPDEVVASKLFDVAWALCASPAFLSRHAAALASGDVGALPVAAYSRSDTLAPIHLSRDGDRLFSIVAANIVTNDLSTVAEAARRSICVAAIPEYYIKGDIAAGRLARLFADCAIDANVGEQAYTLHLPGKMLPRRVRRLLDFLHRHAG